MGAESTQLSVPVRQPVAQPTALGDARGAIRLLAAGFDRVTAHVQEVHRAIAGVPFRSVERVPGVDAAGRVTRLAHDAITTGTYATIRGIGRAVGTAADALLHVAERKAPEPAPVEKDRVVRDALVSAVTGVVGDAMLRRRNPLAIRLGFYQSGRSVVLDRASVAASYPNATPRIAIFVHGLCCNERAWQPAADSRGRRRMSYGERLAKDLGYTPIWVRYNSGLHVSQNGRALSRRIGELLACYPIPIEEIALVGHSMGGLVARSACHAGLRRQAEWTRRVRHVVCIGSPHLGAPLEKATHVGTSLLGAFDLARPWADFLNARSLGIKDLRWGYVADEHWRGRDPDAFLDNGRNPIPRLEGARHHFIGSSLFAHDRHPVGRAVGDGMVRLPSATARELADADTAVLYRIGHIRLLTHPRVYRELRARLA